MKLTIQVKPNSKKPGIEKLDNENWIVRVREQAIEGRANRAVTKAIADELKVAPSRVKLLRGEHSRQKLFEIATP